MGRLPQRDSEGALSSASLCPRTADADFRGASQLTLTPEALSKSFTKYADRETKRITLDGFGSYLMSSDNAALRDESSQDMTRPISEYFISSSHNVSSAATLVERAHC